MCARSGRKGNPMLAHSNWISVRKLATTAMMAFGLVAFMYAPGSAAQTHITVSVSPTSASVEAGTGKQQFTATVRRDLRNRGVLWTLAGAGCTGSACGTLSATSSASGVPITYTAPATVPANPTVTLTATSVSNSTRSASATITVTSTSPVSVTISPTSASLNVSTARQFTATVANDPANQGVTWRLTQSGSSCAPGCGALSGQTATTVTYTAPGTVPANPTVNLTATAVRDTSDSPSATITVTSTSPVSVTISPTSASLNVSTARQFTATVANDPANQGVTWRLTQSGSSCAPGCGALSGQTATTVTYTAPGTVPANPTVNLTATAVRDTSKSAGATITVTSTSPVSVTISPTSASLNVSTARQFTATVANDPANQGVTWRLTQSGSSCAPGCGALSGQTATTVTYTAPGTVPANPTVILTATAVRDTSKSASATITVTSTSPVSVTISPTSASLNVSTARQFTATVANDPANQGVTWRLTQSGSSCAPGCGALSGQTATTVTYTAPGTVPANPTVNLTATAVRDTSKSAGATITVTSTSPVSVTISPTSASLNVSTARQFTATVANDPANQGVTWRLTQSGSSCAPGCGALSGQTATTVTYTAPGTVPANPTVTLTATSVSNSARSASATITVTSTSPVSVTISPTSASLNVSTARQFTATVANDPANQGVSWRLST